MTRHSPTITKRTRTVHAVAVDAARLAMAVESGVFDPEESAAFLKMPSVDAFWRNCRRYKVKGLRIGNVWRFSRETLDGLRMMMFGVKAPKGRAAR